MKEKCVNNERIKKRKNDSKFKRKKPPQKISKKDSVPQEHATMMMQPSLQISNCSKETIDTTPIFRMNAVNEHHIIQSVKKVSEQQAEYFEREHNSSEEKLDRLPANADGSCFFKAALLHALNVRYENDLRQTYVNI